jgi:hypothetical protein
VDLQQKKLHRGTRRTAASYTHTTIIAMISAVISRWIQSTLRRAAISPVLQSAASTATHVLPRGKISSCLTAHCNKTTIQSKSSVGVVYEENFDFRQHMGNLFESKSLIRGTISDNLVGKMASIQCVFGPFANAQGC